jgi:MraZ protein
MFLGRFYHNLDDKGRLMVPARFRDMLVPDGAYILQGFDRNLMVLPVAVFDALSRQVNQMNLADPNARLLRRLLFSSADRAMLDKAGRILIPPYLRDAVNLSTSVVVVGSGDYFEVWSPETWASQNEQIEDAQTNPGRFSALNLTPNLF